MKYNIVYSETYLDVYEVESSSLEEAIEKLQEDILEGNVEGPDICIGCEFKDIT